jgi:DNA-binding NarL/FixJ family response regulator
MLEPLRDFARQALRGSRAAHATYRRHAAFFVRLARDSNLVLLPGAGGPWLEPMAREHDNLHAVLRWLLEHQEVDDAQIVGTAVAEIWRQRGHLRDARALLDQLLALPVGAEATPARAGVLLIAGQLALFQGDREPARAMLQESVAMCNALDLNAGASRGLARLAEVERAEGHYAAARALVDEGIRVLGPHDGDALGFIAGARLWRALIDLDEALYDDAAQLAETLLPDLQAGGWTRIVGHALLVMGVAAGHRGAYGQARDLLERSLAEWSRSDRWGTARALLELARLAIDSGDAAPAETHLAEGLLMAHDMADPWATAVGVDLSAGRAADLGRAAHAVRLAAAALALRERAALVRSPRDSAWLHDRLARAEAQLGRRRVHVEQTAGRAMSLDDILDLAMLRAASERTDGLTPREREVAALVAQGWSDARIAESLVISRRTAETHVRNILGRLGLESRAQIAVWAADHGLLPDNVSRIRRPTYAAPSFSA